VTPDEVFLHDIVANPDDDTPRLIYADWLEDHGDPDRAEFIRLQCELERMGKSDTRSRELQRRERELLEANKENWAGPVRSLVESWDFRRGFIERVEMTGAAFLTGGAGMLRLAPVRQMRLRKTMGLLPDLVQSPCLARLTWLDLDNEGIDGDGRWR
jgi:uncharacterized protein (TIGR02996 family)